MKENENFLVEGKDEEKGFWKECMESRAARARQHGKSGKRALEEILRSKRARQQRFKV